MTKLNLFPMKQLLKSEQWLKHDILCPTVIYNLIYFFCLDREIMCEVNNMLKMQKQTKHNFTPTHLALLDQLENLFSRPNLSTNNYLYKQMNPKFEIPIFIIQDQRRIAQITTDPEILKEALQMCNLVQLIDNKTVRVHQFPTLKFSGKYKDQVNELARNLKSQNRKVSVFDKKQQNQVHLSLLQRKPSKQLQQLAANFDKNWQFKLADLQSDLKAGIAKIRKLKEQNKRNYRSEKYSLDKPPAIFIRRAVQSSDEQQESVARKASLRVKKEQDKEKQKRYRQKPIINEDQFPTLS